MNIMGLDISLTGTGLVVLNDKLEIVRQSLITSKPIADRFNRFHGILDSIMSDVRTHQPKIVFIEGYSYNSNGGSMFDRAELGGIIKKALWDKKVKFEELAPTSLKKFITGKGNAPKELMMLKVFKRFGVEFSSNDLCDAYCLARYGYEYLVSSGVLKKDG